MDSLTQITLGAAVGELVLGKKAGNRAMIWGAIAGTIPDLDIFADPFLSPIDALGFHRGISHSIFFAVLFGALMAYLIQKFYGSNIHQKKPYRIIVFGLVFLFFLFAGFILNYIPIEFGGDKSISLIFITILALGYLLYRFWNYYVSSDQRPINLSFKDWYKLTFCALITHPILDCFTTYGTQLFQPFTDYRVAFNNISVADPIYTLPFLCLLIAASCFSRGTRKRYVLNLLGIAISSLYMIWTIYNKVRVDSIFKNSLEKQGIEYVKYSTGPTILQNVLWHCVAEGDSVYYDGLYSIFDSKPEVKLSEIPKNYDLLEAGPEDDYTLNRLAWFSNGYYGVMDIGDGVVQINDLRFGTFRGDGSKPSDYIFSFQIKKDSDGNYQMAKLQAGPPEERDENAFAKLWERMKGI